MIIPQIIFLPPPEEGGRMTCPHCHKSFTVKPKDDEIPTWLGVTLLLAGAGIIAAFIWVIVFH